MPSGGPNACVPLTGRTMLTGRNEHCTWMSHMPATLRRISLTLTVACFALFALVGCAAMGNKPTRPDLKPWPEIRSDFRPEPLRQRMHEYSITFAAEVDLAATSIEQRATDATVRRNAMLWRVRAIPEMRKAGFRLEPIAALIDTWIFARQMDQLFRDGGASGAFGAFQPEAIEVSRRLVEQMREIAGSIAVSPQARLEFERKYIDPWLAEHPLRDITFVRESPIAQFADQTRSSGDLVQSVGTMEELAVSLSQQARIYMGDLPRQVRGELDLIRSDVLPPEGFATMQGDLHMSAAAADRIASTAESVLPLAMNERRLVLEEISRQRALVMEAVSVEQERAIGALVRSFAHERSEMLRSFEAQRLATLHWATGERREAIAELHRELAESIAVLRGERAIVVDEVRDIVDAVLLRLALFLVAGILFAPAIAHVYARVWPRRWRAPRT
jgi:hypothetical protein